MQQGIHHRARRERRLTRAVIAVVQPLEARRLLSAAGIAYPTLVVADDSGGTIRPPFTPAQIQQAYGINQISFGTTPGTGAGQTIAIIDAFNDPDIASDADSFNSMYGLQPFNVSGGPTFTVEGQDGSTTDLPANATAGTWDLEMSLDVEWAHAIAPMANIILLEANSDSLTDLFAAVDTARNMPGVSVVSMSFGGSEPFGEENDDYHFTTPDGHAGVTFIASTGDSGQPGGYPAFSDNVVAVGGTSLTINADGSYGGETGWSGSGGGVSQANEPLPIYQITAAAPYSTQYRTTPDVAWDADPNTGVSVLDTYAASTNDGNPWFQVGGTSVGAPSWAALISIVDQGRTMNGMPPLDGASETLPLLYDLPPSDFHSTGGGVGGYNLITGRGSPKAVSLVSDMSAATFAYVDAGAPGLVPDGLSWSTAYQSLQSALAQPTSGREIILVGQGTYEPGSDPGATFQLQDNVSLLGGFAGYGVDNPDLTGPQFQSILIGNGVNENVVTASGVNSTAVLAGFAIEDGNAGGGNGGGMICVDGAPTLIKCTFSGNSAQNGGAIYLSNSTLTFTSCSFTGNTAAGNGGGIYDDSCPGTYIGSNSAFSADVATMYGGAVENVSSSGSLFLCTFNSNSASDGAAIDNEQSIIAVSVCAFRNQTVADGAVLENRNHSTLLLSNSLFSGNSIGGGALGVVNAEQNSPITVLNCTFAQNVFSGAAGAINVDGVSSATVANCILWDGQANEFGAGGGLISITYSDVEAGAAGTGNITADPMFVGGGDDELQFGSPCIDAGNTAALPTRLQRIDLDCANLPRILGQSVDMGAYEAQTIYVDASSAGGNGQTWAKATDDLQFALTQAATLQSRAVSLQGTLAPIYILVAAGTYYPFDDDDGGLVFSPDLALPSFNLTENINLYGGYAGASNPGLRDPSAYTSTLSAAGVGFNVIYAYGMNANNMVDGFTIADGNATGDPIETSDPYAGLGGGMVNQNGDLVISDCVFLDNTASAGGAVINGGGSTTTLVNCTFSGNSAQFNSGAISTYTGGGAVLATNCTFSGNSAGRNGGAIYSNGDTLSVTDCTFSGDSAASAGGGIYNVRNSVTLTGCAFSTNSAGSFGGGIASGFAYGVFNIAGGSFIDNTAGSGGGAFIDPGSTISNCLFNGNSCAAASPNQSYGGGLEADGATITGCSFIDNVAANGGGANVYGGSTVANCLFNGNSSIGRFPFGGGGALIVTDSSISGCTFSANTAYIYGALECHGVVVLTGCSLNDNSGGIYSSGMLTVIQSIFYGDNGSFAIDATGPLTVEQSVFSGNDGEAVRCGSATLTDCEFAGNQSGFGDGVYCNQGAVNVTNCTFYGNSVGGRGGAVYAQPGHGEIVLTNCILWGDTAVLNNSNEIYGDVTATYSDVQGGYPGAGNINADPLFVNAAVGHLQLQENSPCINAGSNAALPNGQTLDLAGNPRIVDGTVDMGAYEAQLVAVSWTGAGDGLNWSDLRNWSGGYVPTQNDDVTIAAGPATVQIAAAAYAVRSLNSQADIELDGASLSLLAASSVGGALSILNGGSIDITNASLTVNYGAGNPSPMADIQAYVQDGAIFSSTANANPGETTVGYVDGGADVDTPAQLGQVLIRYTLPGDTNLDGLVNFLDLVAVLQNFNKPGTDWSKGDLDSSGKTDFADLVAVLQTFNKTLAPAAAALPAPPAPQAAFDAAPVRESQIVPPNRAVNPAPAPTALISDPLNPLFQQDDAPGDLLNIS